jgi:hypothetical protein
MTEPVGWVFLLLGVLHCHKLWQARTMRASRRRIFSS